jgi:HEAT repeat protein
LLDKRFLLRIKTDLKGKMMSKVLGLIEKLDTSSDKAADKVIAQLTRVGKPAVPDLIKAAKNLERPRIRKWSLQALGAIADKRAAAVLVAALKDERMTVRLHALRGLARMKYKPAAKDVVKLLKDESGGIRVNAVYTLMILKASSAQPKIKKLLKDPQWYIRQTACEACGLFKDKSSKKQLADLQLSDARLAVRKAAKKALESM